MQGNNGKIRKTILLRARNKISKTSHKSKLTVLGNQQVQTNITIPNNKPDIVISDKEQVR
jgi:hypothetical protein